MQFLLTYQEGKHLQNCNQKNWELKISDIILNNFQELNCFWSCDNSNGEWDSVVLYARNRGETRVERVIVVGPTDTKTQES